MYRPQSGAKFVAWQRHERVKRKLPLVSRAYYLKFFSDMPESNFEFIPDNDTWRDRKEVSAHACL